MCIRDRERGGWKSDKIMKKVYTQTFSEIRTAVDDKIDGYFDNIANQMCIRDSIIIKGVLKVRS